MMKSATSGKVSTAANTYRRLTDQLLQRDARHSNHDYICPLHDDQKPSLGVTLKPAANGEGDRILVTCSAGCETPDILAEFGLTMADLFDRRNGSTPTHSKPKRSAQRVEPVPAEADIERWVKALDDDRYWTRTRHILRKVLRRYEIGWNATAKATDGSGRVGAYVIPYRDADGRLLNVKYRWREDGEHKKSFRLRSGLPTEFLWPADQLNDRWLVLVEGEPDVLRAISNGIPAATWPTGAGGAVKAARQFAPRLKGIHVVVTADASDTGRKTAEQVANLILPYAATVRIFDPFPKRHDDSDLSDWFDRYGDDGDRLREAVRVLPTLNATDVELPSHEYLFPDGTFNPPRLGMSAEDAGKLRTGPGGTLWRFENGVYKGDADDWLAGYVRDCLREEFRQNRLREVRAWCQANQRKVPTQPSLDYINTLNGLVYWRESPPRFEAHSQDVPSIIQINAEWDPSADCPEIQAFFESVLPPDCIDFIFEWFGYLLVPTSRWMQKALMLEGPRDTGKSTMLILVEQFLGSAAVSHHTLQSICDDKFTAADLYGRLANIYADLDARNIADAGRLKAISSGDHIQAEHKYGHPFKFRPYARLMFSANEAPGTSDQSDAYYKRWLMLPMNHQVTERHQDPGLDRRITEPQELSGLLNRSVAALKRLDERGHFAVPKSMRTAARRYRANTDTIVAWSDERTSKVPGARVKITEAYRDYDTWCSNNNRHPLGMQKFKEKVVAALKVRHSLSKGYPVFVGIEMRRDPDSYGVTHEITSPKRRPKP